MTSGSVLSTKWLQATGIGITTYFYLVSSVENNRLEIKWGGNGQAVCWHFLQIIFMNVNLNQSYLFQNQHSPTSLKSVREEQEMAL